MTVEQSDERQRADVVAAEPLHHRLFPTIRGHVLKRPPALADLVAAVFEAVPDPPESRSLADDLAAVLAVVRPRPASPVTLAP